MARVRTLSLQEAAWELDRLGKFPRRFSLGLGAEGLACAADLVLRGISSEEGLVLRDDLIWLWMGRSLFLLDVECRVTQVINVRLGCRLGYFHLARKSLVGDRQVSDAAALDRLFEVLLGEVHTRIIQPGGRLVRISFRLVAQAAKIDELELVVVRVVENFKIGPVRLVDSSRSRVGLLHIEVAVARKLNRLVLFGVVYNHENALTAQS
jgi:hypothetical protein